MSTTDDGATAEVAFDPTRPFRCREPANQIKDWRARYDGRGYEVLIHHPIGPGALTEAGRGPWWHSYGLDGRHHHSRPGSRHLDLVNDPAPVEPAGDPVRDGGPWRPMESAPKDGSWIIGETDYANVDYRKARWVKDCEPEQKGWFDAKGAMVELRRWQPLPPSPGAAPQPDPDLETAITTLLTQVASSHEAYPSAKRDLMRAFLARHGTEARGEGGAGEDDAAFVERMAQGPISPNWKRLVQIARRGARAPVAGGAPEPVAWGRLKEDTVVQASVIRQQCALWAETCGGTVVPLYFVQPSPPALIAERDLTALEPSREMSAAAVRYYHENAIATSFEQASDTSRLDSFVAGLIEAALTAATAPFLLAQADMLLHDAEGDDESMAHGLVHDAAAFLSDREEIRADVRAQYAKSEPPHGHQAPPAAPVGDVTEDSFAEALRAVTEFANDIGWIRIGAATTGRLQKHLKIILDQSVEPAAWQCELAYARTDEGEYFDWRPYLGARPKVPAASVRNLVPLFAAFAARPTPDDGCPKGDPDCLGGNGVSDAGSTFAERGAVEEMVDAAVRAMVSAWCYAPQGTADWVLHYRRHETQYKRQARAVLETAFAANPSLLKERERVKADPYTPLGSCDFIVQEAGHIFGITSHVGRIRKALMATTETVRAEEREACAKIVENRAVICASDDMMLGAGRFMVNAIRSRASTSAAIDGLAPGGRDGTEG